MPVVAVARSCYLPLSETFIYNELIHLTRFRSIVCTQRVTNLRHFPFAPIYKYRSFNELPSILRGQNAQLVHARFGMHGAALLDVVQQLGIPLLTSFHGFDVPSNKQSLPRYRGRLQRLFREGTAFTVTSNQMKDVLVKHGCPAHKVFVHRSGVDLNKFTFAERTASKDGQTVLLCVGRLVDKKGMRYLLDAFAVIRQVCPNVYLRIVGQGPLKERLREQVIRLRLDDRVAFLGALSHEAVVKEMRQAHIFALASVTAQSGNQEGIPNVLKEAMSSGLPVVSTQHAGIPELVQDGKSGFLVPERDSNGLAERLVYLVQHPERWGEMGAVGRDIVEKSFDLAKQVDELQSIYAAVCDV